MTSARQQATAGMIGIDWGSSRLRAFLLSADGAIVERFATDCGAANLTADQFLPILNEVLARWRSVPAALPVVLSGMVGSRQGWIEVPYVDCPCDSRQITQSLFPAPGIAGHAVHIVPGLRCRHADGDWDVMRGEETQVAGLLSLGGEGSRQVCLPGTHCKWVELDGNAITGWRTTMTGELYQLLSTGSILRHAVGEPYEVRADDAVFEQGVRRSLASPASLLHLLFTVRTRALIDGLGARDGRAYLSGLLIGCDIAAQLERWNAEQAIDVIVDGSLGDLYVGAIAMAGRQARPSDSEQVTSAGLFALANAAGLLEVRN
jgi:2-dehydro-3-deoxygalactonokinase